MALDYDTINDYMKVIDYKGDKILPLCSICGDCILEHKLIGSILLNDIKLVSNANNSILHEFSNPYITIEKIKEYIDIKGKDDTNRISIDQPL